MAEVDIFNNDLFKDAFKNIEISPTQKKLFERLRTEDVVDLYAELKNEKEDRLHADINFYKTTEYKEIESTIKMCEQQILYDALRSRGWSIQPEIRYVKKAKNKE